jgi:ribosome-associated heat shock protein Hsp15
MLSTTRLFTIDKFMTGVRIDVWLWAARFFKTRALAKKACELGRILSNEQEAKPAREVRVGDTLKITNDAADFTVEVLALSEERGPASVAQTLYRETEESRAARQKASDERRAAREFEVLPQGRPSKRDRRRIIQFRGRS